MVPYRPIFHVQVHVTGLGSSGIAYHTGPGGFTCPKSDIDGTVPEEDRVFGIAVILHGQHVALQHHIAGSCITQSIIHTHVDGSAEGSQREESHIAAGGGINGASPDCNEVIEGILSIHLGIGIRHHTVAFHCEIDLAIDSDGASIFTAHVNS